MERMDRTGVSIRFAIIEVELVVLPMLGILITPLTVMGEMAALFHCGGETNCDATGGNGGDHNSNNHGNSKMVMEEMVAPISNCLVGNARLRCCWRQRRFEQYQ